MRESKLLPCPPLSNLLKIGYLQKRGNINQGWRRRWCTAANRSDNFVISYYDDPSSSKANGSIECSFMQMIPFNEKETEEAGQYGFKVVGLRWRFDCFVARICSHRLLLLSRTQIQPRFLNPSSSERIWYLRAETEADFHCWTHLVNYSIRNATPRRGFEEAVTDAMAIAVHRTAMYAHGICTCQFCFL